MISQSDADWANFATLQQVASAYDAADRKTQDSAQASGTTYSVVQYGYDAAGRLQCTAQRMNPSTFASLPSACTLASTGSFGPDRITFNTYDNADQLLKVTNGYGVSGLQRDETTYTYSNNGKVKTLADAKNNLTTYVYDGFDRLSQTQYPSPTTPGTSNTADYEQLGYDAASNITSRRLRDGYNVTYAYDGINRLTNKYFNNAAAGDANDTYGYDLFGNIVNATNGQPSFSSIMTFSYDALGREKSEQQNINSVTIGTTAFQYDLAGRRTRLTWTDGFYVTYDYDNVDEMADVKENGSTALASFTYDDLGERQTRTLANGTSVTYGYDPVSRLTSLALAGGTNANTATLSNYSPAGEVGSRANSNDAFAWVAGITGSKAYTINGLNQFATIVGSAQGYDAKGNLTSSGGNTYGYDSENHLSNAGSSHLWYDAVGRLVYDTGEATDFGYDGVNMIGEYTASGSLLRRYVFGPAGDEPIVWYEGSGTSTKRYLDQDERGSVTRITDGSGNTVAINSYDEYGIPASTNQGRFQYTGQAWLPTLGMYYYKARVYSPTLGRFMQTDPIGYSDGPNWYNYVGSDPINLIDPMGLECAPAPNDGAINVCGSKGPVGTGSVGHSDPSSAGDPKTRQPREPEPQNDEIVVKGRRPTRGSISSGPVRIGAQIVCWGSACVVVPGTPPDPVRPPSPIQRLKSYVSHCYSNLNGRQTARNTGTAMVKGAIIGGAVGAIFGGPEGATEGAKQGAVGGAIDGAGSSAVEACRGGG